jgi:hypothetical protein
MSHSNSVQPNVTNGSMVSSDLARAASNVGKPWRILHTESSMEMGGQEYRVLEEALGMANRGCSPGKPDGFPGPKKRIAH